MPIQPVLAPAWTFVSPLELPLVLRLDNGRFGALRPTALPGPPLCASGQVISDDDPANPTGADVHFFTGLHEAVDLAAAPGSCVFAAYSGRVVDVEQDAARGNVTIDHHPVGLGFLTKYNHVSDVVVSVGDFVQKGEPFAAVSAVPSEPHLHFELWAVVDREGVGDAGGPGDSDLVPVDPTRALYAWEERTAEDEILAGGPATPESVGLLRIHSVPFFTASFPAAVLHVPLYEPLTAAESLSIELLREAKRDGASVDVRLRASSFWGVDVVTQVTVA